MRREIEGARNPQRPGARVKEEATTLLILNSQQSTIRLREPRLVTP